MKEWSSASIAVLQMLLMNFFDIWKQYHHPSNHGFRKYKVKKDYVPKVADELELKRGQIVRIFRPVDATMGWGEVEGRVGTVSLVVCKAVRESVKV